MKDSFQTPPAVAKYMVSLLPDDAVTVLEPTPGRGNILQELNDYVVTAPEDYWELDKKNKYDAIIGNPPFSSKSFFNCPPELENTGMKVLYTQLHQLMQMSDHIIILVPWFTLIDSDKRLRELTEWGIVSITALPRKTFNYSRIQTCILHMRKGYVGITEFKILNF